MSNTTTASDTTTKPLEIDEAELARLNNEMITSDLITPDRLLVDLMLVKDYNIATLLSFSYEWKKTRPEIDRAVLYDSLIKGLEAYQKREYDDIAGLFPKFGLTNEEIAVRRSDPNWSRYLIHTAPVTPFMDTLRGQIAVNVNHSAVIGKRDPIEITINTYPLQLPLIDQHIIGLYFSRSLQVQAKVIYLDMTKLSLSDVITYDEIYTYHFSELFSHEEIRLGYETLKFVRKRLFIPRLFGSEPDPKLTTEQQEILVKTRLDVLTQPKFFPVRLCSALSPETDTPKKETPNG